MFAARRAERRSVDSDRGPKSLTRGLVDATAKIEAPRRHFPNILRLLYRMKPLLYVRVVCFGFRDGGRVGMAEDRIVKEAHDAKADI